MTQDAAQDTTTTLAMDAGRWPLHAGLCAVRCTLGTTLNSMLDAGCWTERWILYRTHESAQDARCCTGH